MKLAGVVASLLQDLGRVFRGQTRHFAEHHDPVVNELLQRVPLLPQGYPQELFNQLIAASRVLFATLLGMNPGKQFPPAVDCRTIDADGYRQLYLILLAYFVFQLMVINPAIQNIYLFSLALVCGASEEQRGLLARLRRVQMLLPRRERKSPDIAKLGQEAWTALKQLKQQPDAEELAPHSDPHVGEEIDRLADYIRGLLTDYGIKKDTYTRS